MDSWKLACRYQLSIVSLSVLCFQNSQSSTESSVRTRMIPCLPQQRVWEGGWRPGFISSALWRCFRYLQSTVINLYAPPKLRAGEEAGHVLGDALPNMTLESKPHPSPLNEVGRVLRIVKNSGWLCNSLCIQHWNVAVDSFQVDFILKLLKLIGFKIL